MFGCVRRVGGVRAKQRFVGVEIAIAIGVHAGVANSVAIGISLVAVEHRRAVVGVIRHEVAILVRRTTGVKDVCEPIAVVVNPVGAGLGEQAVLRRTSGVVGIGAEQVLRLVVEAVIVSVEVAPVARAVVVRIRLIRVGVPRTVIIQVEDTVGVRVGDAAAVLPVQRAIQIVVSTDLDRSRCTRRARGCWRRSVGLSPGHPPPGPQSRRYRCRRHRRPPLAHTAAGSTQVSAGAHTGGGPPPPSWAAAGETIAAIAARAPTATIKPPVSRRADAIMSYLPHTLARLLSM